MVSQPRAAPARRNGRNKARRSRSTSRGSKVAFLIQRVRLDPQCKGIRKKLHSRIKTSAIQDFIALIGSQKGHQMVEPGKGKAQEGAKRLVERLNWICQKTPFEFKAAAIRKHVDRGDAGVTPSSKPGHQHSAQPSPLTPCRQCVQVTSSCFCSWKQVKVFIITQHITSSCCRQLLQKKLRFKVPEDKLEHQDVTGEEEAESCFWKEDNEDDQNLFLGNGAPAPRPREGIIRDLNAASAVKSLGSWKPGFRKGKKMDSALQIGRQQMN